MLENALMENHAGGLLCLQKDGELSWSGMAGSPAVVEGAAGASGPACFSGQVQPPESPSELRSSLDS